MASFMVHHELHCMVRYPHRASPNIQSQTSQHIVLPQKQIPQPSHGRIRHRLRNGASRYFHLPTSHASTALIRSLDHCINIIRQQAMCRADMTVASWYWKEGDLEKPWPRSQSPAHCVNWDAIESWLEPRNLVYVGHEAEPVVGIRGEGYVELDPYLIKHSAYD